MYQKNRKTINEQVSLLNERIRSYKTALLISKYPERIKHIIRILEAEKQRILALNDNLETMTHWINLCKNKDKSTLDVA